MSTVFDSISSKIDEVLLIDLSANVFAFEDFNVHHKNWLTYPGGTDQPGELYDKISISNDLTQILLKTFQLGSETVILMVLLFCFSFF